MNRCKAVLISLLMKIIGDDRHRSLLNCFDSLSKGTLLHYTRSVALSTNKSFYFNSFLLTSRDICGEVCVCTPEWLSNINFQFIFSFQSMNLFYIHSISMDGFSFAGFQGLLAQCLTKTKWSNTGTIITSILVKSAQQQ